MSEHQQPKPKSQERHSQEDQRVENEAKEIQMQQIMHEINPQQHPLPQQEQKPAPQPPVVKNPVYLYKGHEKYDWRLDQLEPVAIIEKLQGEPYEWSEELPFENQVKNFQNQVTITISETPIINKHVSYTIKKTDRNGEGSFTRRYTEYLAFRRKLVELWPGLFIPTLPNKTLIGSSEEEVIRSRVKYILHFWRKLSCFDKVYYSDEVKLFMNDEVNIQATLEKIQTSKVGDLLEKYKNCFPEAYENCHRQEFMYKKDQAPVLFQEFQLYFGKKKIDLLEFKDAFMRLAELKGKYIRAVSKLNQTLLPSYEHVLFNWFNGAPMEKEPGIMEKINRKSQEILGRTSVQAKKQGQKPAEEGKEQKQPQKEQPPVIIEQPLPRHLAFPNPLYNSQAYKSKLQDTAHLIQDYNSSVWVLYDVLKFQTKDIDTVLQALEQVKSIQKEIEYLKRSIAGNKEQIQSLNNKKTTLKTFFMGGSEDDKKTRLANESQAFEEKLEKTMQFYHILLALVQEQLVKYHSQRVEYYTKAVKKSVTDELSIARSVMDFHIYEYQLFAKQRGRKLQEIKDQTISEQPEQEQIKQ